LKAQDKDLIDAKGLEPQQTIAPGQDSGGALLGLKKTPWMRVKGEQCGQVPEGLSKRSGLAHQCEMALVEPVEASDGEDPRRPESARNSKTGPHAQ